MAMEVGTTYTALSASAIDVLGMAFIKLRNALVATGLYRQQGAGDGRSAHTTGDTDIFTANSGLGYKTSGTWGTGVDNSFSNATAWFRLQALDGSGTPTGWEFQIQRGTGTALGNDRFLTVAWSPTGFSGTPSATSPYTGGTQQFMYSSTAWNGAGANMLNTSTGTPYLGGSGTFYIDIWHPGAASAGDKAPPWRLLVESATRTDGSTWFVEKLLGAASADAHPYIVAGGTSANMTGSTTVSGVPTTFNSTLQNMYTVTSAGAITNCEFVTQEIEGGNRPGSATALGTDAASKYSMTRLWVATDTANPVMKGYCESLRHNFPASSTYMGRAVFNDGGIYWFSGGHVAFPWSSSISTTNSPGTRTDVRDALPNATVDTTPPTIGSFSPAAGAISTTQAITVHATDAGTGVQSLAVYVVYANRTELAYVGDGTGNYLADYDAGSSVSGTEADFTTVTVRDGGWLGAFTLYVVAVDGGGNVSTSSAAYTLTTASVPVLASVSPSPGAIAYNDSVSFTWSDSRGLENIDIFGVFDDKTELIYSGLDANDFAEGYTAGCTATPTGITSVAFVLDPGWRGPFTLLMRARDTEGTTVEESRAYTITTWPNPAAADSTAPTITKVSPSGKLSKTTPVVLDISDDRTLRGYFLFVKFPGTGLPIETVYISPTPAESTPYIVTTQDMGGGTTRLTIRRKVGWTYAPTFFAFAIDTSGNMSA